MSCERDRARFILLLLLNIEAYLWDVNYMKASDDNCSSMRSTSWYLHGKASDYGKRGKREMVYIGKKLSFLQDSMPYDGSLVLRSVDGPTIPSFSSFQRWGWCGVIFGLFQGIAGRLCHRRCMGGWGPDPEGKISHALVLPTSKQHSQFSSTK